ncbi:hypothetical protein AMTRI_Chr02g218390 [Amborella trichopoda]
MALNKDYGRNELIVDVLSDEIENFGLRGAKSDLVEDIVRINISNTTRTIGRKRIAVLNDIQMMGMDNYLETKPLKRHNSNVDVVFEDGCIGALYEDESETHQIDELPFDILVKILCRVEHSDLKALSAVSKLFREAVKLARKVHFNYSTPNPKIIGVKNFELDVVEDSNHERISTPNAPKQDRFKLRLENMEASKYPLQRALFSEMEYYA